MSALELNVTYAFMVVVVLGCGAAYGYSQYRAHSWLEQLLKREAKGCRQFNEPGTGAWMSLLWPEWYAMSDSGARYPGGPWPSLESAQDATVRNAEFLREYALESEDIAVPLWRPKTGDWGNDWTACNLVNNFELLEFWVRNDAEMLSYR